MASKHDILQEEIDIQKPFNRDYLCDLFELANIADNSSLNQIRKLGGDVGLA